MSRRRRLFRVADVAQQVVGGFLLAGPFVVTEEVWVLAEGMTTLHAIVAVSVAMAIGYGTLYKADRSRDPDAEQDVGGIPIRFLSLMVVSFGSVALLSVVFAAPSTFEATPGTMAKAISVGAIFSVIGAATADSLF
ncbi:MAG: DUF2391 family protein [Halodesulfurarchaeum sp.]